MAELACLNAQVVRPVAGSDTLAHSLLAIRASTLRLPCAGLCLKVTGRTHTRSLFSYTRGHLTVKRVEPGCVRCLYEALPPTFSPWLLGLNSYKGWQRHCFGVRFPHLSFPYFGASATLYLGVGVGD